MRTEQKRTLAWITAAVLILCAGALLARTLTRVIYPRHYEQNVTYWCETYGVDESLVYAVIHTESSFNPSAVSETGALGLMQIMPDTFEWLQTKTDEPQLDTSALYDPDTNIRYGVFFLSMLIEEFGSDRLAIAAYHAGRGKVGQWLDEDLPPYPEISDIPSRTTGHYVYKVENAREMYVSIYYS